MRVSRTAWWIAGSVAVLPPLCIAGVALIGRELDDLRGAEGHLRDRAELVELQRRFLAMSPAQHLTQARSALASFEGNPAGWGALAEVTRHLDAIPAGAPEHAQTAPLRARVQVHRLAALGRGLSAFRAVATSAPPGPSGHTTRCAMFTAVSERVGLRIFSPGPPYDETVLLHVADCDAAALRRLAPARDALLRMNVLTARCAEGDTSLRVQDL